MPHQYHLCIHHFYCNHLATCNHKTILSPVKGSSNEFSGMSRPQEQPSTNETGVLFGLNAQLSEPWLKRTLRQALRSPQGLSENKLQLSTAEAALRCSLNWLLPLHFFTSTSWDHLPQKTTQVQMPYKMKSFIWESDMVLYIKRKQQLLFRNPQKYIICPS